MGGGPPRPPHTDYGENKRAPIFGVSKSKYLDKLRLNTHFNIFFFRKTICSILERALLKLQGPNGLHEKSVKIIKDRKS